MRRTVPAAVALIFALALPAAAPPKEDLIPDPDWVPNSGDRAEVTKADAPAGPSLAGYAHYLVSVKANDSAGLANLTKLPKGTPVLILRGFRPAKPAEQPRVVDEAAYFREIMFAESKADFSDSPVEVRILDGPAKGQVRVLPESFVTPLIPRPDPTGYTRVEGDGPLDRRFYQFPALPRSAPNTPDAVRAANLLRVGLKAEKSGDVGGAIACFHRLMKDFRDLPEAKGAANRMDAMGVVRLPNGGYLYDPQARVRQKRPAPKAAEKQADPSRHAATLLSTAKNLEKLRKITAAVASYREVAEKYPGTAEANEAAARIKTLGGK